MSRFSDTVMDHCQSPRNWGRMAAADRVGVAGVPGQGRFLVLYLRLDRERIAEVTFQCHGCGATIACGSLLTELITGQTVAEVRQLSPAQLLEALGGLPPDKQSSAALAVQALRQALAEESAETTRTV